VLAAEPDTCELLCLDLPKAGALRQPLPSAERLQAWAERAKVLADPTRLTIAIALRYEKSPRVRDQAWVVGRDEKLASHHVRRLKAAGVAHSQGDARWSCTSSPTADGRCSPAVTGGEAAT
jgi:hypothetical protein